MCYYIMTRYKGKDLYVVVDLNTGLLDISPDQNLTMETCTETNSLLVYGDLSAAKQVLCNISKSFHTNHQLFIRKQ